MGIDSFDKTDIQLDSEAVQEKIDKIHDAYDPSLTKETVSPFRELLEKDSALFRWLRPQTTEALDAIEPEIEAAVDDMYYGTKLPDGEKSLGLREIAKWPVGEASYLQDLGHYAEYAAEVISTIKDNLLAKADQSGLITYRSDDLPELYGKDDPIVDKVKLDKDGNVVEKIQSAFIGNTAAECLKLLASEVCDKFFVPGAVDKIEIPGDFYDSITENDLIKKMIESLMAELSKAQFLGDADKIAGLKAEIARYEDIDKKLVRSTVANDEARYAARHPREYSSSLFVQDALDGTIDTAELSKSLEQAPKAIELIVDSVEQYLDGKLTVEEFIARIITESGAMQYLTKFFSDKVYDQLSDSAKELIEKVLKNISPAEMVAIAFDIHKLAIEYSEGNLTAQEFAIAVAKIIAIAAFKYYAPIVLNLVAGTTAATAYKTAQAMGVENADKMAEQTEYYAKRAMEAAISAAPEKAAAITAAFNAFAKKNQLPIKF